MKVAIVTGPHPAVADVRRAVREALAALEPGRPLLVACSGGADSLALAAAVAFEAPRAGRYAGAVVVDHGLQPGSADVAARTCDLLTRLGLDPVHIVAVDVGARGGPEAAARKARYDALARIATEAADAYVVLGHTRDDQAETVLLGLGRGSGPRSIAGMRTVDGRYVRPLLALSRATTQAACAAQQLPVWNDPHNVDPRFRRVRLRTEALPLLEDILDGGSAGGVAQALARTATQVRQDLDALDDLAAAWLNAATAGAGDSAREVEPEMAGRAPAERPPAERGMAERPPAERGMAERAPAERGRAERELPDSQVAELAVAGLLKLPPALRTRALRLWATRGGAGPLNAVHVDALDGLCTAWHGQGPLNLPAGVQVVRRSGRLALYRRG